MTDLPSRSALTDLPRLLQLLEQERSSYRELLRLGREQAALIEQGQPEPLLALLARRQETIGDLQKLNGELESLRQGWNQRLAAAAAADRQKVAQLLEQIRGLRDQIVEQDTRDTERLRQTQDHLGVEVNRMARAGRAARSYGASASGSGSAYTDRRG